MLRDLNTTTIVNIPSDYTGYLGHILNAYVEVVLNNNSKLYLLRNRSL